MYGVLSEIKHLTFFFSIKCSLNTESTSVATSNALHIKRILDEIKLTFVFGGSGFAKMLRTFRFLMSIESSATTAILLFLKTSVPLSPRLSAGSEEFQHKAWMIQISHFCVSNQEFVCCWKYSEAHQLKRKPQPLTSTCYHSLNQCEADFHEGWLLKFYSVLILGIKTLLLLYILHSNFEKLQNEAKNSIQINKLF